MSALNVRVNAALRLVFMMSIVFASSVLAQTTADLALSGSAPATAVLNTNFNYTIGVTNLGPGSATSVTVMDVLPSGTAFVPAGSSAGCVDNGGTVSCAIGSLASGGVATVTVVARPGVAGTLRNVAGVIATEFDATMANNSQTWVTTVSAPAPTLTGVSPSQGPAAGGTLVTLTGANFVSGATVTFGGVSGTAVTFVNSTQITGSTPGHGAGAVDVVVRNPDGQSASRAGAFTYLAAGAGLYTVASCRVIDTRNATGTWGGPALQPGATRVFPLAGRCAIPSTARSVVVNLTATDATASASILAWAADVGTPPGGLITVVPGQARANSTAIAVSADGTASIRVSTQSTGTVQMVLDVVGYFR